MKTKCEDFSFFQGYAGNEMITNVYMEQQMNPQNYFKMEAGNRLTGITDKTAEYLFIPENITEIASFAFAECNRLIGVFIPKTVIHMEGALFVNCPKLTFIDVDKKNPRYDSRYNCNAVIDKQKGELVAGCRTTIIPEDIVGIGQFAFYMQYGLKSITIPKNISYISKCVFKDCRELVDVKFSSELQEIGFCAFSGCVSLLDIVIPKKISNIEESAFESVNHIWYDGQLKEAPWGAWNMN